MIPRTYFLKREQAKAVATDLSQTHDSVYSVQVTFEPNNGWICRFYAYHNVPAIVEAGHELHTPAGAQHDKDVNKKRAPVVQPKRVVTEDGTVVAAKPRGGATARVWEIADKVTGDGPIDRAAIIAACIEDGINKSTAGTQYSKWKKARS